MILQGASCLWQQAPRLLSNAPILQLAVDTSTHVAASFTAARHPTATRAISSYPLTTDRSKQLPSPTGGDAYQYWSKIWKERPDNRREVRRPKDLKRIPRWMYLPDIEDKDISAIEEALLPLAIPPRAVKQIIQLAKRGLVTRDPDKLSYRVNYLLTLQEHLPGFDAVKMATRPGMLNYDPERVHEQLQKLQKRLPHELTGAFMAHCHKMVMEEKAHPTLAQRWKSLNKTLLKHLKVAPEPQNFPHKLVQLLRSPNLKVGDRVEKLRKQFGAPAAWQMLQHCPDILDPMLTWRTSAAAVGRELHVEDQQLVDVLAAAPQLLCQTPQQVEEIFRLVRGQLRGYLGRGSEDRQLLLQVPQLLVLPPSQWLAVPPVLTTALGLTEQQQLVDLISQAPHVLLRPVAELEASAKALVSLPSSSPLGVAPDAAKQLLKERPQLLLQSAGALSEALQLMDGLCKISEGWAARGERLRGKTSALADLLLTPELESRLERLAWLLKMKVQQAPSAENIGFEELLQMDDNLFAELYPGMAWSKGAADSHERVQ